MKAPGLIVKNFHFGTIQPRKLEPKPMVETPPEPKKRETLRIKPKVES